MSRYKNTMIESISFQVSIFLLIFAQVFFETLGILILFVKMSKVINILD